MRQGTAIEDPGRRGLGDVNMKMRVKNDREQEVKEEDEDGAFVCVFICLYFYLFSFLSNCTSISKFAFYQIYLSMCLFAPKLLITLI